MNGEVCQAQFGLGVRLPDYVYEQAIAALPMEKTCSTRAKAFAFAACIRSRLGIPGGLRQWICRLKSLFAIHFSLVRGR